jgi:hypothetical protein
MPRAQGCAGVACVRIARHVSERYIAIEHMDVRRDCLSFALRISERYAAGAGMRRSGVCQDCTAPPTTLCPTILW